MVIPAKRRRAPELATNNDVSQQDRLVRLHRQVSTTAARARRQTVVRKGVSTIRRRRGESVLSVGIDVANIAEVATSLDRFGDRYVRRVFTPTEAAYCRAAGGRMVAARFAARFAAKEAAIKALAPAGRRVDWRSVEVCRNQSGRCWLLLHREASALAARRGIDHLALSLTHEGDHAAAIVIALRHS